MEGIKEESVAYLFNSRVEVQQNPIGEEVARALGRPHQPSRLYYNPPTVDDEAQVERRPESASGGEFGKVGRNAHCPCGSGKKYKLCHGDPRNRLAF
jgi:preprotein translocase subunit SecA